jgi:23S rRNA (adenine-N6)-dimethyltransferase
VVARGSRTDGSTPPARRGQHFLDRSVAADLVRRARIAPDEVVLELGAGTGALTRELARTAASVVAIEIDPRLAERLRRTCAGNVTVATADMLVHPLPRAPFRAFGNIPFASTTSILRRLLDDPTTSMTAADLVVQWEVAKKRTTTPPGNVLSLLWGPFWSFEIERRIPASAFRPRPRVDAAMLSIRRHDQPLLSLNDAGAYERVVRHAFRRAGDPLTRALRPMFDRSQLRRIERRLELRGNVRPIDLSVREWVELFRTLHRGA